MTSVPGPLQRCLDELQKLPGVGPKSAQRILFALLQGGTASSRSLAEALAGLGEAIEQCTRCRAYVEKGQSCPLCDDPRREASVLCVVESPADVFLVEATGEYSGLYHVLHGLLSPLKGIHPEHLGLEALKERLETGRLHEVILATPPTAEGEATASYLVTLLSGHGAKVTRIAFGMPVGANFQFVDAQTLGRSLSGRKEMS